MYGVQNNKIYSPWIKQSKVKWYGLNICWKSMNNINWETILRKSRYYLGVSLIIGSLIIIHFTKKKLKIKN